VQRTSESGKPSVAITMRHPIAAKTRRVALTKSEPCAKGACEVGTAASVNAYGLSLPSLQT
jgi:hypothetical protein